MTRGAHERGRTCEVSIDGVQLILDLGGRQVPSCLAEASGERTERDRQIGR